MLQVDWHKPVPVFPGYRPPRPTTTDLSASAATSNRPACCGPMPRGSFPGSTRETRFSGGRPILGAVFEWDRFHISRRLGRTLRLRQVPDHIQSRFRRGHPRLAVREEGTWITDAMIRAYEKLHELGHAHSVEAWQDDELAGGLYGVRHWQFLRRGIDVLPKDRWLESRFAALVERLSSAASTARHAVRHGAYPLAGRGGDPAVRLSATPAPRSNGWTCGLFEIRSWSGVASAPRELHRTGADATSLQPRGR